jgi:hypothetical protein
LGRTDVVIATLDFVITAADLDAVSRQGAVASPAGGA